MHALYQSFMRSVWWNAAEALTYNGILMAHQWLLFHKVPNTSYGLIGLLFSYTYLAVAFANLGFDYSIGSYWHEATISKENFTYHIWYALALTYLVIIGMAGILFYSGIHTHYIDNALYWVIVGIIACESFKKSGKVILQLMFKNHITALVDVLVICVYVALVWGVYWYYKTITLYTIFIPLLVIVSGGAIIFYQHIIRYFYTLPCKSGSKTALGSIVHQRAYSFLNTIMHQLFSGNVLTPLFAMHFDLGSVGIIKLISQSFQSIGAIIHNIFGLTAHALFANTKHMHLSTKQQFFHDLTYKMHQLLYACIIFGVINYQKLIGTQLLATSEILIIALYLVIMFSENFFIPYEKIFLTEEKTHYWATIHLTTWVCLYLTMHYLAAQSLIMSLSIIIILRLASYGLFSLIALRAWNMKPSWQMQPLFGLAATLGSVLFFLWW